MDKNSPYYKPIKPKNEWELLKWVIFEPLLLERYTVAFSMKEVAILFLKMYMAYLTLLICCWLITNAMFAFCDIPFLFLSFHEELFQTEWLNQTTFLEKFLFLLKNSILGLIRLFPLGFPFGLAFGLTGGLIGGLIYSLANGLVIGFFFGSFSIKFDEGFYERFIGLRYGLFVGLLGGLFGLFGGLIDGFTIGLATGFAFIIGCYVFCFRIPFYFYHQLKSVCSLDFNNNPYLKDGVIWLPIIGAKNRFTNLALKLPEKAELFIEFLLEYRPLQKKLAMHLTHAAIAGHWQKHPLNPKFLEVPLISEGQEKFQPSDRWENALSQIKEDLNIYRQQNNLWLKQEYFQVFYENLQEFKSINLTENSLWNKYYFEAINKWLVEAKEELEVLNVQAGSKVRNPYRTGDALDPLINKEVFRGREDLKDKLGAKISIAQQMPFFLIQGQRRVGKTSLLNFLPGILGTGFKVIKFDMQLAADCQDVPSWMNAIHQKVNKAFNLKDNDNENWQASNNWLQSWKELSANLSAVSKNQATKIILAFDEYEDLHKKGFSKHAEDAGNLLGAMRAFSQQQNQVVFLFVGSAIFSELNNPTWSDYFPHIVHLPISYLSKKESINLLVKPYPDFPIKYEEGLPEKIFELTQGHPELVQRIAYELVDKTYIENRLLITQQDLDTVIKDRILLESNGTILNFWKEFCRAPKMQETVLAIIQQKEIPDRESLKKLLRHRFIQKNADNQYYLQVPLFEMWVRKFEIDL